MGMEKIPSSIYSAKRKISVNTIITRHYLSLSFNCKKTITKCCHKLKWQWRLSASENNHYHWDKVHRRHFLGAAKNANFSPEIAEVILDDMLSKIDIVIQHVSDKLSAKFPKQISQANFCRECKQ